MRYFQRKSLALVAGGIGATALIVLAADLLRPGSADLRSSAQVTADEPRELVRMTGDPDLANGGYALVLGDIITGRGPLLIEDTAAIQALSRDLWYSRPSGPGASGSPQVEVGALLAEGKTLRLFTCPESDCGSWFIGAEDQGAQNSGFAALRKRVTLPGRPVEHITGYYDSYEAYQRGHAAILSAPDRWFARPGAERLQAEDEAPGEIEITLPVELLSGAPEDGEDAEGDLAKIGADWLQDIPGHAEVTLGLPEPIRLTLLPPLSEDGTQITLPGLQYRSRMITLRLAGSDTEAVAARIGLSPFQMPDLLSLTDAMHQALAGAGYDTACLPGCAVVELGRINQAAGVEIRAAPGWQIESWRLSEAD